MAGKGDSLRQQFSFRDLIKQFKYRQVSQLLDAQSLDANAWLRWQDALEGDEEEATALMIIARVPASPAEKREAVGSNNQRRGSTSTNSSGDSGINSNSFNKYSKERVKMARLFMKHGADVNIRDAKGRTALMYASANGLNELVYFFLYQVQANFHFQDQRGENSVMLALPFPMVIQTYLDYMNDTASRPSESFWRQRNRNGKSIFDLAKDISGTSRQSLAMLTNFITNASSFISYKAPPPIPTSNHKINEQNKGHSKSADGKSSNSYNNSNSSSNNNSDQKYPRKSISGSPNGSGDEGTVDRDCDYALVEATMKRSKSLKEFWEKEAIDWFNASAVIQSNYSSSTRNSADSTGSLSGASDIGDSTVKLPPIPPTLVRHEEWRERGHSLNRRTSVSLLRTVNPIH